MGLHWADGRSRQRSPEHLQVPGHLRRQPQPAGQGARIADCACLKPMRTRALQNGWTALMLAARSGHLDVRSSTVWFQFSSNWVMQIVEFLVRVGADCKKRTRVRFLLLPLPDIALRSCSSTRQSIRSAIRQKSHRSLTQVALQSERRGSHALLCSAATKARKSAKPQGKPVVQWNEDDVCAWLQAVRDAMPCRAVLQS